jgi:hypothetical protein
MRIFTVVLHYVVGVRKIVVLGVGNGWHQEIRFLMVVGLVIRLVIRKCIPRMMTLKILLNTRVPTTYLVFSF